MVYLRKMMENNMMKCDVVIIGAGAAGLLCAHTAAQRGLNTVLLERNPRAGRKLMITGKGRCNVTNACTLQEFMENVPRNPRFLYAALSAMGPEETMTLFTR